MREISRCEWDTMSAASTAQMRREQGKRGLEGYASKTVDMGSGQTIARARIAEGASLSTGG